MSVITIKNHISCDRTDMPNYIPRGKGALVVLSPGPSTFRFPVHAQLDCQSCYYSAQRKDMLGTVDVKWTKAVQL